MTLRPLDDVRAAFNNYCVVDSDSNESVLRRQDVQHALWELGLNPVAHDVNASINAAVGSLDVISWAAFKELYVGFRHGCCDPLRVVKRFMLMDEARTGYIDEAALRHFLQSNPDVHADTLATRMWEHVAPKTEDGSLSAMEFTTAVVHDADPHEVKTIIKTLYHCKDDSAALRWLTEPKPKRRKVRSVGVNSQITASGEQTSPLMDSGSVGSADDQTSPKTPPKVMSDSPDPEPTPPSPPPPPKRAASPPPPPPAKAVTAVPKQPEKEPEPKKEGGCCIVA
jgi:Ca2+-binding EF-hand superfamily protein